MIKNHFKTKFLIMTLPFLFEISFTQKSSVTISRTLKDVAYKIALLFVNIVLKIEKGNVFVTGLVSDEHWDTIINFKSY